MASNPSSGNGQVVKIALPKILVPPIPLPEYSDETWHYELRHKPQEIVPGVWIGPLSVLRNSEFIEGNNIHVLISVTDTRIKPLIMTQKYIPSPEYSCHAFDPGNRVTNPLAIVSQLKSICDVIQQAQDSGVGTFIFCESGNDQSAVAASAYLIFSRNLGLIEAVQYVQSKRFSISLDDVAKHNLQTFRDLCLASNIQPQPHDTLRTKMARGREDDDEGDITGKRRMRDEWNIPILFA